MKNLLFLFLLAPVFSFAQDKLIMRESADTLHGKITYVYNNDLTMLIDGVEKKIPYYMIQWMEINGNTLTFAEARKAYKRGEFEFETLEEKGESYLYQAGQNFNSAIASYGWSMVFMGVSMLTSSAIYDISLDENGYVKIETNDAMVAVAIISAGVSTIFVISSITKFVTIGNLLKKAGRQIESAQSFKE